MTGNPRRANGARRDKVRAVVRSWGRPCAICGDPIDYSLPPGDPWSFEVDEIIPVSKGGSPFDVDNCQPAHRRCNQWRGARGMGEVLALRVAKDKSPSFPPPKPSTSW